MTAVDRLAGTRLTVAGPLGSFGAVSWSLALRSIRRMRRIPSLILPVIVMPIFFVVAFAGSFNSIASVPGFPTDEVINWVAAWSILQGGAFAGVGAAGSTAVDLESGFYDRLLLAPVNRLALLAGQLLYAAIRALIPATLVICVAALAGADQPGGALGIASAYVGAIGTALVFALFGMAVVLRSGTQRSLALVQVGIFGLSFISIGQVPIAFMSGWMEAIARVNPVTNILRLIRQGYLGDVSWSVTWPGLLALGGSSLFFGILAVSAMRRIGR